MVEILAMYRSQVVKQFTKRNIHVNTTQVELSLSQCSTNNINLSDSAINFANFKPLCSALKKKDELLVQINEINLSCNTFFNDKCLQLLVQLLLNAKNVYKLDISQTSIKNIGNFLPYFK